MKKEIFWDAQFAGISAVEQEEQRIWRLGNALNDVVFAFKLAFGDPLCHLCRGRGVLVCVVEATRKDIRVWFRLTVFGSGSTIRTQ